MFAQVPFQWESYMKRFATIQLEISLSTGNDDA